MTKCNCHETRNIYPNLNSVLLTATPLSVIPLNAIPLSDEQQFRLNKNNEINDYFVEESKERYIASFDYFDKSLIVFCLTTGSISIASLATVIGTPVGIASASFSFTFLISTGIVKKLLKQQETKIKSIIKLLC